ncbi:phytoene desaturase family protein [Corynebacterium sp. KPL2825]|uniref:phytoene desaturase family protein n=1 Tax=Corynebacterium sp. KPL2825 TaxID=3135444 RepID=UPI0030C986F8
MDNQPRAVIVGAGPNGLTAAARLAMAGWSVDIYERADWAGGAAASSAEIFPGTIVDLGAAGHPFGVASPAFHALDLESHGLRWLNAPYPMAHPLEGAPAGILQSSLADTAAELGVDAHAWTRLHGHIVRHIDEHVANALTPLVRWPDRPVRLAQFGAAGTLPASQLGRAAFATPQARALFAGSAVHAITSPTRPFTSAFGLLFGGLGMTRGWPVVEGGTGALIDALLNLLRSHHARLHTGCEVRDLRELPAAEAIILNLTPQQILGLRGLELPSRVRRSLARWRYGSAVFKVDFHLSEPVPWTDPRVGQAGTVHVGGTVEEICRAEGDVGKRRMPERPLVLACQQYVADPSRGLTLWTYAHVPRGYAERYPGEVTELITAQIERFAPGFRDTILATHATSPAELERWNPNLVGGDIAGGSMTGLQTLLRPRLSPHPHRLAPGVYIASSSAAPGAGVHGMPGWWAAEEALSGWKGGAARKRGPRR